MIGSEVKQCAECGFWAMSQIHLSVHEKSQFGCEAFRKGALQDLRPVVCDDCGLRFLKGRHWPTHSCPQRDGTEPSENNDDVSSSDEILDLSLLSDLSEEEPKPKTLDPSDTTKPTQFERAITLPFEITGRVALTGAASDAENTPQTNSEWQPQEPALSSSQPGFDTAKIDPKTAALENDCVGKYGKCRICRERLINKAGNR
ncbi:MAG: hypothetical protein AAF202_10640 [Pseudomonadota bacterium]